MKASPYLPGEAEEDNEPLLGQEQDDTDTEIGTDNYHGSTTQEEEKPFSRVAYAIFLLLGLAMLWAWNMFLAAAPYFQRRFRSDPWILNHFQPAETSVATVTNLATIFILSRLQKNASYPRRIITSLLLNLVAFTILGLSTFVKAEPRTYFGFLLVIILFASTSTAFIQNGVFSFTTGFGRDEYTQAIMTGQAIAGVLPPLVQIISVVAVPPDQRNSGDETAQSPRSAFIYFITATVVSGTTLVAFFELLRRKGRYEAIKAAKKPIGRPLSRRLSTASGTTLRSEVPLTKLFMSIPLLSTAVITCFAVTMASFPIFTTVIQSTSGIDSAIFIPTGFLIWNIGDLIGRLMTLSPRLLLTHYPFAIFSWAMARFLFIPLYFLCNIKGRGAIVNSDLFYLILIQLPFGISNGYVGSNCMMGAGKWVQPEEREAAGGFMALCLTAGLTIGSLLSFVFGNI